MKYTPALDDVHKELVCVCLWWNTTDNKDHSAVVKEELNHRTELNVGE